MTFTFADLPLDELLSFLAEKGATGTLTVATSRFRKKLFLVGGTLGGVASDNPRELLGHFLVGWGLIDETQLAEAMAIHERLATPLGRILERMGAIDGADLENALRAQAEEALLELFLHTLEEKRWLENVLPADRPITLSLPLPPLVLEGTRRRERFASLKPSVGGFEAVPSRVGSQQPAGLSGRELHILAEIDGERDIDAIALACHLVPFHVAEFIERGVREGFLGVATGAGVPPAQTPAALVVVADSALKSNDLRRAWDAIDQLRRLQAAGPTRLEVGRLERVLAELLAQRRIAGNLIPVLRSEPGQVTGLRPAEAFVLSRVNGSWCLREIQRIAPFDELEFGVIVEMLLRQGLIELRHPKGGPAGEATNASRN